MENNAYLERIHQYLANEMDGQEKAAFEHDMHSNEQLSRDVQLEKKLLSGILMVGDDDLKNSIASTHQRLAEQQFFDKSNIRRIRGVHAPRNLV